MVLCVHGTCDSFDTYVGLEYMRYNKYFSHSGSLNTFGKCVSPVQVYHTKKTQDLAMSHIFK